MPQDNYSSEAGEISKVGELSEAGPRVEDLEEEVVLLEEDKQEH